VDDIRAGLDGGPEMDVESGGDFEVLDVCSDYLLADEVEIEIVL